MWRLEQPDDSLAPLRKRAKDLLRSLKRGDTDAVGRFHANHPQCVSAAAKLADAQLVIAREEGYHSWPKMKTALSAGTLAGEIARVQRKLIAGGKPHFIPLLTAEAVKAAIGKGIDSYESHGEGTPEGTAYFRGVVQPLFADILERGVWPPNATLDIAYTQTDERGVSYDGIGVSLEFRTPGQAYPGFSHAILDLWYGRY